MSAAVWQSTILFMYSGRRSITIWRIHFVAPSVALRTKSGRPSSIAMIASLRVPSRPPIMITASAAIIKSTFRPLKPRPVKIVDRPFLGGRPSWTRFSSPHLHKAVLVNRHATDFFQGDNETTELSPVSQVIVLIRICIRDYYATRV